MTTKSISTTPSNSAGVNPTPSRSDSLQDLYEFGAPRVTAGLGQITTGLMTKGDGSYVEYSDGRRYLDFTCGIGVTNLGHAHPSVSGAAAEQCMKLVHSQVGLLQRGKSFWGLMNGGTVQYRVA